MSKRDQLNRILNLIEINNRLLEHALEIYEKDPDNEQDQWIGTGDAALLMGVSPQTIRNWVKMGVIKGKSLSQRKYVVYKPDVQAYGKNINEQGGKDSLYHIL